MCLYLYLSVGGTDASSELTVIESLGDAAEAVESCVEEMAEDAFFTLGMYGGTVEEERGYSSFATIYGLDPVEDMEASLASYLEEHASDCVSVLEETSYTVEENGRMSVTVVFGEEVSIDVPSLGNVVHESGSMSVDDVALELDVDFTSMYALMEELYSGVYGVPLLNEEAYLISLYVDEDYSEQLISIEDESGFVYQVTKKL